MEIISKSYLSLFEALRETNNAVVYIPTEAGIPMTEATRLFKDSEPLE